MKTTKINTTIKRISLLIIMVSAAITAATGIARADGTLTLQEQHFGDAIATSVCNYIDSAGVTTSSMSRLMRIIYDNTGSQVDMSDTVDIINYVVSTYCPDHWRELVTFGDAYRHAA